MNLRAIVYFGISAAIVLSAWQLLGSSGLTFSGFSTPIGMIQEGENFLVTGKLQSAVQVTLFEIGTAFALCLLVGVPVGLIAGRVRWFEYAVDPYITVFLSLPKIAIWPLILFVLGIDVPSKIFLGFILGVFPLIVNTMNGSKNIDPLLIDVAYGFRISRGKFFTRVVLPAAFPNILTGTKLAFGRCTSGVIIGEVLGSLYGIGRLVSDSGEVLDFAGVFVGAFVIFLIGILGTELIGRVSSRLTHGRVR